MSQLSHFLLLIIFSFFFPQNFKQEPDSLLQHHQHIGKLGGLPQHQHPSSYEEDEDEGDGQENYGDHHQDGGVGAGGLQVCKKVCVYVLMYIKIILHYSHGGSFVRSFVPCGIANNNIKKPPRVLYVLLRLRLLLVLAWKLGHGKIESFLLLVLLGNNNPPPTTSPTTLSSSLLKLVLCSQSTSQSVS